MNPTYQPDDDRPGLTVVDPVQNTRYPLKTTEPVEPVSIDLDGFYFPVDSAVTFTTEKLVLPYVVPTVVRDREGTMLCETEHYAYESLPEGEYILEFMAPIRLSVRVRAAVTIASSDERLAVAFGEPTRVRLGARSLHERPAATVTTTAEPDDLARAVSTFGSALKTLSCERSLPTLRGHPPRLELGDELRIPAGLEPPESGVTIVVPPERTAIYAVSSLAYYLGATVVTGSKPRLETDRGFEYSLGESGAAFERSVERVLTHVFFLDCLTRTEGFYRIDLYERQQADERLDVAFDELYDEPLAEQLAVYLSLPFEAVADLRPTWQLATHVTPDPENVTVLPFLADDLSIVTTAPDSFEESASGADDSESESESESEREPPSTSEPISIDGNVDLAIDEFVRSSASTNGDRNQPSLDSFVSPPNVGAFEQAWLGDGIPIGANKLVAAAFENGLERSPSGDDVEITIVCNDSRMLAELDGELYGDREELPFDVTVHRDCSVAQLRDLIAAKTDFFHYVGHVEDGAFVCRDGTLESASLVDVGVETFLLNGCQSYEPGIALLEAGSSGGIVTVSDVGNPDAVAVGRLIARLLNTGFTLRSAVDVARSYRLVGTQYVVVGDGGSSVTQSGGGVPNVCRIETVTAGGSAGRGGDAVDDGEDGDEEDEDKDEEEDGDAITNARGLALEDENGGETARSSSNVTLANANTNTNNTESLIDRYRIRIRLYHSTQTGMGALYIPYIDGIDQYFLVGGDLPLLELSGCALTRFFHLEEIPVEVDGELRWSSDTQFENL